MELAVTILDGVGDVDAGGWIEHTHGHTHVRYRLTKEEADNVGPVRDIRGTLEQTARFRRALAALPKGNTRETVRGMGPV